MSGVVLDGPLLLLSLFLAAQKREGKGHKDESNIEKMERFQNKTKTKKLQWFIDLLGQD